MTQNAKLTPEELAELQTNQNTSLSGSFHSSKKEAFKPLTEHLSRQQIAKKEQLKNQLRQNPQDTKILNQLNELYLFGANLATNAKMITARELHGRAHQEQQDAFFVGIVANDLDAKPFYQSSNSQLYADHKECRNGSTLTSFIFKPSQQNWQNSSITTNNIGDSRISLNIENDKGEFISIALTKDQDLSDVEIRDAIQLDQKLQVLKVFRQEGKYKTTIPEDNAPDKNYQTKLGIFSRQNCDPNNPNNVWMTQVGSFGDNGDKKFGREGSSITGYPYFNPQINQFSLNDIIELLPQSFSLDGIKNVNIIIGCDGIYDSLENDYQLIVNDKAFGLERINNLQNKTRLSDVEKSYKSTSQSALRKITSFYSETNRADYIAKSAFGDSKNQSNDNITAAHIKLINNKELVVLESIMSSVADGHGSAPIIYDKEDGNHALASKNQLAESDGSFVAASIIAKQMFLAQAQPIFGPPSRYVA